VGTQLVKDIRPGPLGSYISPSSSAPDGSAFTEYAGALYFNANDWISGPELWRTDGTAAGTQMVSDILPGFAGSSPHDLVSHAGLLYFFAAQASNVQALYKYDSVTGGLGIVDLFAWPANPFGPLEDVPNGLTSMAGKLLFRASSPATGYELWSSDGTPFGTSVLAALNPSGDSDPENFMEANGLVFFNAEKDNVPGTSLFRTDGTAAGTFELNADEFIIGATAGPSAVSFFVWNAASVRELWTTDGSLAGTNYVMDAPAQYPVDIFPGALGAYFFIKDVTPGYTLRHTTGSVAGTLPVGHFEGFCPPSQSGLAGPTGTEFWFGGDTAATGCEPWHSDGTPAGTQLVANLVPELTTDSSPGGTVAVGDEAYFLATPGGKFNPTELFVTDGTAAGTQSILAHGSFFGTELLGCSLQGNLIFRGNPGGQVWKSDGTAAGTQMIFAAGSLNASVSGFVDAGSVAYFQLWTPANGLRLWRTDGTTAGTFELTTATLAGTRGLVDGPLYYFRAADAASGSEPWVTDGTVAGTQMLADVSFGSAGSSPQNFTKLGDKVFFVANTPFTGDAVVSTTGPGGTTQLAFVIGPGTVGDIRGMSAVANKLLVLAADNDDAFTPGHGELWTSLGSQASTSLAFNLATTQLPATFSTAEGLITAGDFAYFFAGQGLWSSDGNLTTYLHDFPKWNSISSSVEWRERLSVGTGGTLVFYAQDNPTGTELWRTNGTPASTVPITEVLTPGATSTDPSSVARMGGLLLFTGDDPLFGRELFSMPITQLGEAVFETFGAGCAASSGLIPKMQLGGDARLGMAMSLGVADAPASQAALLYYAPATEPLLFGACTFLVGSPLSVITTSTSTTGTANLPFVLPTSPALIGVGLFAQWVVLDPAGPPALPFATSDAVEIQIGS